MDDMTVKKHWRFFVQSTFFTILLCGRKAGFLLHSVKDFWKQLLFIFTTDWLVLQLAGQFKSSFNWAYFLIVRRKDTEHNSALSVCLYVNSMFHDCFITLLNSQEYSQLWQLYNYISDFRACMHYWQKSGMGMKGRQRRTKNMSRKVKDF